MGLNNEYNFHEALSRVPTTWNTVAHLSYTSNKTKYYINMHSLILKIKKKNQKEPYKLAITIYDVVAKNEMKLNHTRKRNLLDKIIQYIIVVKTLPRCLCNVPLHSLVSFHLERLMVPGDSTRHRIPRAQRSTAWLESTRRSAVPL